MEFKLYRRVSGEITVSRGIEMTSLLIGLPGFEVLTEAMKSDVDTDELARKEDKDFHDIGKILQQSAFNSLDSKHRNITRQHTVQDELQTLADDQAEETICFKCYHMF
ncbi:CLUMA_CG019293, isoform A [Clunio marinus]|uniref:CLUMA_CG019293, isoform A n=1 Tax=Clunio marinus TaxID=568069 RepID=A0A1J1J0X8_9DIPT|nr:CLUMA_CG019293, isoform A [Clunio marinus]